MILSPMDLSRCFHGVRSIHQDTSVMLIYVHFDLSYTFTLSLNRPIYSVEFNATEEGHLA